MTKGKLRKPAHEVIQPTSHGRDVSFLTWRKIRRVVLFLSALAIISRLSYLGVRTFHHDESLDAWFSLKYLDGTYKGYDPVYHGPLRFYITAAFFWLFGQSDSIARLLPAISGIAVVALPWIWRRNLGLMGTPLTVTLILTSPTMLYFSRFGREDSFFLLLTFLTAITLLSFLATPKRWHPVVILVLFVLGLAVKESVFLTVFIFGSFGMVLLAQDLLVASIRQTKDKKIGKPSYRELKREVRIEGVTRRTINVRSRVSLPTNPENISEETIRRWFLIAGIVLMFATFLWVGTNPGEQQDSPTLFKLGVYGALLALVIFLCGALAVRRGVLSPQIPVFRSFSIPRIAGWALAVVVAAVFFVAIFTQFFQQFNGPGAATAPHGAIRNGLTAGFEYWLGEQATVRGDSRWQYYLVLLFAYEWLALVLAVVGTVQVVRKPNLFGQVIVWWAFSSLIVYSWAGERMPWLTVHLLLPIMILAGIGAQSIWDRRRQKISTVCLGFLIIFGMTYACVTSIYSSYLRGGEPQELFVQAGQATPEVAEWAEQLEALDRLSLAHFDRHLQVKIDSDVYWPYGWYLRDFPTPSYAVIGNSSFPSNADIVFVPHWDRTIIEEEYEGYMEIPYEHRWWWVPEFDTGITGPSQIVDLLSSWGSWIWSREPWDSKAGVCPASLSGSVYIKNEIYELGKEYFQESFPSRGEKPSYEKSCGVVSNFLTRGG